MSVFIPLQVIEYYYAGCTEDDASLPGFLHVEINSYPEGGVR
jgi:hypothetical protein